jgi:hypothetical protein
MTATKPDLRVRAVAHRNIRAWFDTHKADDTPGRALVLVDAPGLFAAALPVGSEWDACSPGFASGVMRALIAAGVRQSGGDGVAALHRRTTALAQAVQSIGRVLSETATDIASKYGEDPSAWSAKDLPLAAASCAESLAAISEVCEGVAADVFIVDQGKAARATLAAHGWTEGMFPALPGKRPHNWVHTSMYGYAWVERGLLSIEASAQPPAVLRAFATLAEETRP